MSGHILAVDVGNSRIKFGLFANDELSGDKLPTCLRSAASSLDAEIRWSDVCEWFIDSPPAVGVIAGANPDGVQRVVESWPDSTWPRPLIIERPFDDTLAVKLAAPEKVGVDRLLNAVAANRLRAGDRPAIIVSSGTATTVDYVDGDGAFAGGAILPGFELASRALHQYTALLPYISMDELDDAPLDPLGLNTRHALCSGLFWGQIGAVRELISRFSAFSQTIPHLFLTGGGAKLLAPQLASASWEPHLALQGLVIAMHAQLRQSPKKNARQ